jgi:hypothetical protein
VSKTVLKGVVPFAKSMPTINFIDSILGCTTLIFFYSLRPTFLFLFILLEIVTLFTELLFNISYLAYVNVKLFYVLLILAEFLV